MSVQERVHDLLDGVVATLDVELVDVEFTGGTLRVTVDAEGGVTTESLAEVNRLISPILDQHDPVPGRYTLEVSSPGLERPLRRHDHYRRAIGEQVVVKLVPAADVRRLRGTLLALDDPLGADTDPTGPAPTDPEPVETDAGPDPAPGPAITIEVVEIDGVELDDPVERRVELDEVASARTLFEWGPTPKPGGPKAGRPSRGQSKPKPRGAR